MIKLNKKAAKNTAISLTAKKYTLACASSIIGISADDCITFLTLRHYIQETDSGYMATALGFAANVCVNNEDMIAFLTQEGLERLKNAFYIPSELVSEGQKVIDAINLLAKYGLCVNN